MSRRITAEGAASVVRATLAAELQCLEKGFYVHPEATSDRVTVKCRHCGSRWMLKPFEGKHHGGNILHLLNHAAEHEHGGRR